MGLVLILLCIHVTLLPQSCQPGGNVEIYLHFTLSGEKNTIKQLE